MRTLHIALIALIALSGPACTKKGNTAKATDENNVTSGTSAPEELVVPENLKHDAYHFHGLGNEKLMTYTVKLNELQIEGDGTMTTVLDKIEEGKPVYVIQRTGQLADLGLDTLQLDDGGITMLATSIGEIGAPAVEMPASLSEGTAWDADLTIKMSRGGTMVSSTKNIVAGMETIKVEAGEFECLVIKSDLTGEITGATGPTQNGRYTTKSVWYWARDVGLVKLTANTRTPDGKNKETRISLKKIGE